MTYNHYDYATDTIYSDNDILQYFNEKGGGKITSAKLPIFRSIYADNWDVLDTDYNNYAIIYSCNNVFFSYYREV